MANQLPDLDSLTPEELEKLAEQAREDMSASSEIWLIISEATTQEKIAIASVLLLRQIPDLIRFEAGCMAQECPGLLKAYKLSKQITDNENRIALAADILNLLIPYEEEDDDPAGNDEPMGQLSEASLTELITIRGIKSLRGNEIKEALNQGDINKAFHLACEAEAIKDTFYAGHPAY